MLAPSLGFSPPYAPYTEGKLAAPFESTLPRMIGSMSSGKLALGLSFCTAACAPRTSTPDLRRNGLEANGSGRICYGDPFAHADAARFSPYYRVEAGNGPDSWWLNAIDGGTGLEAPRREQIAPQSNESLCSYSLQLMHELCDGDSLPLRGRKGSDNLKRFAADLAALERQEQDAYLL